MVRTRNNIYKKEYKSCIEVISYRTINCFYHSFSLINIPDFRVLIFFFLIIDTYFYYKYGHL